MIRARTALVGTLALLPAVVSHAGFQTYAASASSTSSTLFGGDRRLDALGFSGSSTVLGNEHFLPWVGGTLATDGSTYGWLDAIPRDASTSGNVHEANPDRADNATPFAGEGAGVGTLAEVFGAFDGYKNMSWLIDGEGRKTWTLDLRIDPARWFAIDDNPVTVELAILERGGNSDFNVYGILPDSSLTQPIFAGRSAFGAVGWTLNSLEIGAAQPVHGIGFSLDSSWQSIVGLRLEGLPNMGGPDLVAVGAVTVPAPAAIAALLGLPIATGGRRRQRG